MKRRMRLIVAVLTLSALASVAFGQRFRRGYTPAFDQPLVGDPKEWTFARLAYDGRGFRGGSGWSVDYPYAEYHFSQAVERLTRIDVNREGHVVSPNSDTLFDYPWLYAVEVGSWAFDPDQAARMREYLLRGGFLMVDDFHGNCEWTVFMDSMRRVFPDRVVVDIPRDHEIFRLATPIEQFTQVWGIILRNSGVTYENGGVDPTWRGIFDDAGRLMVVINHNMDLGDGWEHANDPRYPTELTAIAYRFAINYVVYAMTH